MRHRLKTALDLVIDWTTVGLMTLLAGVVFAAVITRYLFNLPLAWSEEVSRYSFIWATFLGAVICTREGAHLSVDLLVQRFSPALQRHIEIAGRGLTVLLLGAVFYSGVRIMEVVHAQQSPALGVPMSLVYGAVPVGAALMLLELAPVVRRPAPPPPDAVSPR